MKNLNLRLYNFLLDSTIFFICFFLIILIFKSWIPKEYVKLIAIICYFFYYFCFELFLKRTPAKYLTKTEVTVNKGENRIRSIFIRSLIRLIPLDIISYLLLESGLHDKFSYSKTIKVN